MPLLSVRIRISLVLDKPPFLEIEIASTVTKMGPNSAELIEIIQVSITSLWLRRGSSIY